MLNVIALGDYYATISDMDGLPEVRNEVNEVCHERFRRIDRFIQLCLLGSARCVNQDMLNRNTGLYIGSRFAAICNTIQVQEQMFVKKQIPRPANFINTLSNSAGYYVARNFQLEGKNLFVSRGNASLEAALQLASLDLLSGRVEQALVGVVDEGVLPVADHCLRLGVPTDTALAEGSHWFLLSRSTTQDSLATITDVCTISGEKKLKDWLKNKMAEQDNLLVHQFSPNELPLLSELKIAAYNPALHYYPSRTGGVLLRFIQQGKAQALITICDDGQSRFHVTQTVVNR